MSYSSYHKLHRNGFTIVEVLVVVMVIGILVAITTMSYVAVTNNAKQQTALTDAQTASSYILKYKANTGGYPANQADFDGLKTPNVQSTMTYAYDPNTNYYCVMATMGTFTARVRGSSSKAEIGTCPDTPVANLVENPSVATLTGYSGSSAYDYSAAAGNNVLMSNGGYSGSTYVRRTFTGGGVGGIYYSTAAGGTKMSSASTYYSYSGWVRTSKATSIIVKVEFRDASTGTVLGVVTGTPTATNNSGWTRVTYSGGGPANARVGINFVSITPWNTGDYMDLDAVMFNAGAVYQYGDGSLANWAWLGTADASASVGQRQ